MPKLWRQGPGDELDYTFDWGAWLAERGDGDTIADATVTVPEPLTEPLAQTFNEKSVTYWASGGIDGTTYEISCEITTANGRTAEDSMLLRVEA